MSLQQVNLSQNAVHNDGLFHYPGMAYGTIFSGCLYLAMGIIEVNYRKCLS